MLKKSQVVIFQIIWLQIACELQSLAIVETKLIPEIEKFCLILYKVAKREELPLDFLLRYQSIGRSLEHGKNLLTDGNNYNILHHKISEDIINSLKIYSDLFLPEEKDLLAEFGVVFNNG